jgi:membrane-bound metal-dependent hydrolase YbcI (DUF457 family)
MQLGHVPLSLAIATYDWNPRTAVFCLAVHWLPNVDSFFEKWGWAKQGFHCTVTHSILFALAVGAVIYPFSPHYALFGLIAVLFHYVADIGSTVGLPLFWPFSKKKFTLALFQDTGSWGWAMFKGYYRQPMAWVLESIVVAFFGWRLWTIYGG